MTGCPALTALGAVVAPATMESLIDAGVDGLITDYPDRLRAALARRGFKPPAPRQQPPGRDCIAEAAAT